jgi:serine/threonine-protein kinase ULK/ATG1
VGDWVLGCHLGSGSFAVVWKARHALTGQVAAVKEINLARLNAKLRQSLDSEVSILRRISHANVVQLFDVVEAQGKLFLIMEFCAGGDLSQRLRAAGALPEPAARRLLQQLAAGLRELWTQQLVHVSRRRVYWRRCVPRGLAAPAVRVLSHQALCPPRRPLCSAT